jgi:hypothetical protein
MEIIMLKDKKGEWYILSKNCHIIVRLYHQEFNHYADISIVGGSVIFTLGDTSCTSLLRRIECGDKHDEFF